MYSLYHVRKLKWWKYFCFDSDFYILTYFLKTTDACGYSKIWEIYFSLCRSQVIILIAMVSRIALSFSMFFLLCVAESAYKAVRLNYLISLNSWPHLKLFAGFDKSILKLFEVLELKRFRNTQFSKYEEVLEWSYLSVLSIAKYPLPLLDDLLIFSNPRTSFGPNRVLSCIVQN